MYSQYNGNLYQPLRADTEGSAVNCERVETFAQKMIQRTINFNWLQFREHGPVKYYIHWLVLFSRIVIGQAVDQL